MIFLQLWLENKTDLTLIIDFKVSTSTVNHQLTISRFYPMLLAKIVIFCRRWALPVQFNKVQARRGVQLKFQTQTNQPHQQNLVVTPYGVTSSYQPIMKLWRTYPRLDYQQQKLKLQNYQKISSRWSLLLYQRYA